MKFPHSVIRLRMAMLFGLVLSTFISTTARSEVMDYALIKMMNYQQTTDDSPGTFIEVGLMANMWVDWSFDKKFDSVSLYEGETEVLSYPKVNDYDWDTFVSYGSQTDLDAAFPDGTEYTVKTTGELGTFSEPIKIDSSMDFPNQPYFTGTVFSDAQALDPSQDFTFAWNLPSNASYQFVIENANGTVYRLFEFENGTEKSAIIDSGTLVANTDYVATLYFYDLDAGTPTVITNPARFENGVNVAGEITEYTGFITQTRMEFSTVPEPSTIVLMLIGLVCLVARQRRVPLLACPAVQR